MLKIIRSKFGRKTQNKNNSKYSKIDIVRERHLSINELKLASQFTDIILQTLDGIKIPAHKLILAKASSYFKRNCKRDQNDTPKQKPTIEVPIESTYMRLIILFIYTGEIQVNCENFRHILEAAELLQMSDLQQILMQFIENHLSFDNIFEMFRSSRHSTNEDFRETCTDFIRTNKNKFLKEFGIQLSFDEFFFILNITSPSCNQQALCEHIVKWVKYNPMARLHHLQLLLQKIDLIQLSSSYISKLLDDKILMQDQHFGEMAEELKQIKKMKKFII